MGYTRLRYTRSSYFGYLTPGVKWLLISNTAMFLLTYLGGPAVNNQARLLLGLRAEAVVHILMVWQVVTYMFLHAGITHILFNMLALWMFGSTLEQDWGTRRFLKYYFLCGIAAEFLIPNQGQVHGRDLRRHRIIDDIRPQHGREHDRASGRHVVRVHLPEGRVASQLGPGGGAIGLPAVEAAAGQAEVSSLHAKTW